MCEKGNMAELLYTFMGWLSTREEVLVLSRQSDAAPAVDAVAEFCKVNGFEGPTWDGEGFVHPQEGEG